MTRDDNNNNMIKKYIFKLYKYTQLDWNAMKCLNNKKVLYNKKRMFMMQKKEDYAKNKTTLIQRDNFGIYSYNYWSSYKKNRYSYKEESKIGVNDTFA